MNQGLQITAKSYSLNQIKQLHAYLITTTQLLNKFTQTKLISLYTFSYNTMIRASTLHSNPQAVLQFYSKMRREGASPDGFTFNFLLESCRRTCKDAYGMQVHGHIIKLGWASCNKILDTNLAMMYVDCGQLKCAMQMFDKVPQRDVVSWSAIIAIHARKGDIDHALRLLDCMGSSGIHPNEVTLMPIIQAIAKFSALTLGKQLHNFIDRSPYIRKDTYLSNAIVYMYAKCGDIDKARWVFDGIIEKDVWSWSVMIEALAIHGHGEEALRVFSRMLKVGVLPNEVTLLSVLSACSHSGLVSEGRKLFREMNAKYGLVPRVEHYGCIVGLHSRAGLLDEAQELVWGMGERPNGLVWRALAGGCMAYGNVEMAKDACQLLLELDRDHVGDYVLMSNVYASVGRWKDVERERSMVDMLGLKKVRGVSAIELDDHGYLSTLKNKNDHGRMCR
ncbi:hypothetical protein AMTRI_Chr02g219400 [Amborella trichopoda]